tara:strand:+ start:1070 stop:1975 length:906 start_codon:yes stop_codon:yes gene_type:complete
MYKQENPGHWLNWLKKPENSRLSVLEAKQKYLKEQLIYEQQYNSFVEAQRAVQLNVVNGGTIFNGIVDTFLVLTPVFQSITGNTQSIKVNFKLPVTVSGTPTVTATNSQSGGGSAATFSYSYASGTGTKSLTFEHVHPASANNDAGAAANVLTQDKDLFSSITTQPTTATADTYVGETMVYAAGTGGTGGSNVTATIVVGDLEEVTSVIVTDNASGVFSPGNTLTLAGSNLGGSGNFVVTLTADNLTGDVISIGSQTLALNGGSISTVNSDGFTNDTIRRQGIQPNLGIPDGKNTKTVVAS